MKRLDKLERLINREIDRGEWQKADDYDRLEKILKEGAKDILRKKPVSIRLSERDIMLLKRKSLETGVPYQTIIATLVRQYVEGKIKIEL